MTWYGRWQCYLQCNGTQHNASNFENLYDALCCNAHTHIHSKYLIFFALQIILSHIRDKIHQCGFFCWLLYLTLGFKGQLYKYIYIYEHLMSNSLLSFTFFFIHFHLCSHAPDIYKKFTSLFVINTSFQNVLFIDFVWNFLFLFFSIFGFVGVGSFPGLSLHKWILVFIIMLRTTIAMAYLNITWTWTWRIRISRNIIMLSEPHNINADGTTNIFMHISL